MVRYSFLVRLSHPLLHAGFIPALTPTPFLPPCITLPALMAREHGNIATTTTRLWLPRAYDDAESKRLVESISRQITGAPIGE